MLSFLFLLHPVSIVILEVYFTQVYSHKYMCPCIVIKEELRQSCCDDFTIPNKFPHKDVQGKGIDRILVLVEYSRKLILSNCSLCISRKKRQQFLPKIYV